MSWEARLAGGEIIGGYKPIRKCPSCGAPMRVNVYTEQASCTECPHRQGGAGAWEDLADGGVSFD